MSAAALEASLGAIRQAGSVYGVVFAKGHDLLLHDTPYEQQKVAELASTVDDIIYYFEQEKRQPDQLVFGYDGGNLLIMISGDHRLVVFHHQADEVDFVAMASRAFLKDYLMSALASEWLAPVPVAS
ncbi:MAG: hypothetical protein KDN18_08170 [Verrucomicrobiae bacterium]|nr:hypothetical protein [Verrucomicrobiae bacterium]